MTRLWDKGHTPINIDTLKQFLKQYPNQAEADELYFGFLSGFRLQYTGPRYGGISKNLVSADQNKVETLAKLIKEVRLGRMLGPFSCPPISTLRTSPIGLVPKSDGTWRLITHLSYPSGNSINDFIGEEFRSVKYSTLDSILDMIYNSGVGAKMARMDIKSAFRLMIMNPSDFHLLGIHFDDKYYIDKCLPFGCGISCQLFEKFANFVQWVVKHESGLDTMDHYLDDFFFVGAKNTLHCEHLVNTFRQVSQKLGIPIAEEKTMGPSTVITFLGFVINSELRMVIIPPDKLSKLRSLLEPMLTSKKIKIKDLESITGLLSYCSRAIPSSRAFIRRFYDLLASVKIKKPYFRVKINNEIKADVVMWLKFLSEFNGQVFFPDQIWYTNDTLQLYTDAAGNPNLGCGAYFCGKWVQFRWPATWQNLSFIKNLALLELIPIVLALFIWAPQLVDKRVIFNTDNQALVHIMNKRTSKDKQIMKLIRPMVLNTMLHNIQFRAVHIYSSHNDICDAISRFQLQRFRTLAPQADKFPERIPDEFLTVISQL